MWNYLPKNHTTLLKLWWTILFSGSIILKMIGFLKTHIKKKKTSCAFLCFALQSCAVEFNLFVSTWQQQQCSVIENNIETCCWNWIYSQCWLQLILWRGSATLSLSILFLARFSAVLHAVNFSFRLILISVRKVIFLTYKVSN